MEANKELELLRDAYWKAKYETKIKDIQIKDLAKSLEDVWRCLKINVGEHKLGAGFGYSGWTKTRKQAINSYIIASRKKAEQK